MTYSSSLKELLQRKISALERQLHHRTSALSSPDHHDDDVSHRNDGDHHDDDNHHDDGHSNDHKDDYHDSDHSHSENHTDHDDDSHNDDHHDADGHHVDHDDSHHDDHDHDDDDDDNDDDDGGGDHHSNEADGHSYIPHTGYRAPGPHVGFHSNKLEIMLNQLHLAGTQPPNMNLYLIMSKLVTLNKATFGSSASHSSSVFCSCIRDRKIMIMWDITSAIFLLFMFSFFF